MPLLSAAQAYKIGRMKAQNVANYLLQSYCKWQCGEISGQRESLAWTDYGARDAYRLVAEVWKLRMLA